jgi:hypothetical protein
MFFRNFSIRPILRIYDPNSGFRDWPYMSCSSFITKCRHKCGEGSYLDDEISMFDKQHVTMTGYGKIIAYAPRHARIWSFMAASKSLTRYNRLKKWITKWI